MSGCMLACQLVKGACSWLPSGAQLPCRTLPACSLSACKDMGLVTLPHTPAWRATRWCSTRPWTTVSWRPPPAQMASRLARDTKQLRSLWVLSPGPVLPSVPRWHGGWSLTCSMTILDHSCICSLRFKSMESSPAEPPATRPEAFGSMTAPWRQGTGHQ